MEGSATVSAEGQIIRVLIVDDHPVVRQGLQSLLSSFPDILVIGEADSCQGGLEQAALLQPDVVLLDIRMPGGVSGIEVTRQLRRQNPTAEILILTAYEDDEYLVQALHAGAHGYLLKSASHETLAKAIRDAHGGRRVLSPSLVDRVLRQFEELGTDREASTPGLSESELEILRLLSQGATNKEIGDMLSYSEATAKRKVGEILSKLGVQNRAQAVAEAMKRGLM
jgi:DNA-binding NarL/FixJ family response regulator